MAVTEHVIAELYKIRPPDTWDHDVFDIPGELGLIPHDYAVSGLVIYNTELARSAVHAKLVAVTVPNEFAAQQPERPSALLRLETLLFPIQVAECNNVSERRPDLMSNNAREFLVQGPHWERMLLSHLQAVRDQLAVLMGRPATAEPPLGLLDIRRRLSALRDRFSRKIDPIERELINIRSHWMLQAFFEHGVVPHFQESNQNAPSDALKDRTAQAIELGTRLVEGHRSAGDIAYQKLAILRGRQGA
jgi:hypothetical protein